MKLKKNNIKERIKEATLKRDKLRKGLFTTKDNTRETLGNVQNGLYLAQMATGLFKDLTNYHLSPKKRIQKVAYTVLLTGGIKLLKNFIIQQKTENITK
jgi:hypothetical protein